MKPRTIIASFIVVSLIIVIALLILGTFIFGMTACGCGSVPRMTAKWIDNSTIAVTLQDMGDSSLKGLHVKSPTIANPEVIPRNEELVVGQEILMTDPSLARPTHLVVTSWDLNGEFVLVDTTV